MLRLPFNYVLIGSLYVAPDWNYCAVQRATASDDPEEFITYQYNAETGDCYWGHYALISRKEALADMVERSQIQLTEATAL